MNWSTSTNAMNGPQSGRSNGSLSWFKLLELTHSDQQMKTSNLPYISLLLLLVVLFLSFSLPPSLYISHLQPYVVLRCPSHPKHLSSEQRRKRVKKKWISSDITIKTDTAVLQNRLFWVPVLEHLQLSIILCRSSIRCSCHSNNTIKTRIKEIIFQ